MIYFPLQLEFYTILHKVNSPLKKHVPETLACGILYLENETHKIVPWDGKVVPDVIGKCNLIPENNKEDEFPFGVWAKKLYELKTAGMSVNERTNSAGSTQIWPFIITKRCKGKIYAELRDALSWEDTLNLASFLGEQLHNLHILPCPPFSRANFSNIKQDFVEEVPYKSDIPPEWEIFIRILSRKRKDVISRLKNWYAYFYHKINLLPFKCKH
jgi:hypothetical protein